MPHCLRLFLLTSRIFTSTTTSPRALSLRSMIRSAMAS